MNKKIYHNSTEYVTDELYNINLLLKAALLDQITKQNAKQIYSNFSMLEEEMIHFLNVADDDLSEPAQVIAAIHLKQKEINEKLNETVHQGIMLPIVSLTERLSLSKYELYVLFFCLAYEINPVYGEIYAYLQNDPDKQYLSPKLLSELLNILFSSHIYIRDLFSYNFPLIKWQLIYFQENNNKVDYDFFLSPIYIDQSVMYRLLDHPIPEREVDKCLTSKKCRISFDDLYLDDESKKLLSNWSTYIKSLRGQKINHSFLFNGQDQLAHEKAAVAFANSIKRPLLELNLTYLLTFSDPIKTLNLIIRDIILHKLALYIYPCDLLISESPQIVRFVHSLLKALDQYCQLSIFSISTKYEKNELFTNCPRIYFDLPDNALRQEIWQCDLDGCLQYLKNIQPSYLANMFAFSESKIKEAIKSAVNKTIFYTDEEKKMNFERILIESCKEQCQHNLSGLAVKVESKYEWHDHVNYQVSLNQLKEIPRFYHNRLCAFESCGLSNHSSGRGLHALFIGPSGTGKTMAASVIANALKLDLYKIDLSRIVSKYIGETEKNLAKVFNEAKSSNGILFFDEADALFGNRSQVKNAHDRYANIEVSYLLQKMEEYDGLCILASNLNGNIDRAFIRRLHYIIHFCNPNELLRKSLWQKIFSKKASIDSDVDYDFLAKNLQEISGGTIKNIALKAAAHAASEDRSITMRHIIMAAYRELKKIGKHASESNFAQYYDMIQEYDSDNNTSKKK